MSAGGCDEKWEPHYDLDRVKCAFRSGNYVTPNRVRRYLHRRPRLESCVLPCIESLTLADFHKSQPHRAMPGQWMDVYRPWCCGYRLYVKFTVADDGREPVLLSFCRDGEAH